MTPVPKWCRSNIHSTDAGNLKAGAFDPVAAVAQWPEPAASWRCACRCRDFTYRRLKTRRPRRLCRLWNGLARALRSAFRTCFLAENENRQEEVRELMEDQFVAEVMPYLSQLNGMSDVEHSGTGSGSEPCDRDGSA